MKKALSLLFTGFLLMSCSAAHNTKVKDKIVKEYGTPGDDKKGDNKKKVVVQTKSQIEKAKTPSKPVTPLLKKEDYKNIETENLVATSNISVSKTTVEDYITTYSGAAMQSMKTYGIPASIKLAQGILESGSGNGTLCRTANNHFGIKCKEEWTGETVAHTDDAPNECFRKYKSALESYNDHSEFLAHRAFYKDLFTLDKSDYTAWAKGLKKAGYATDPKYPSKLISIIERYKLYEYDQKVLNSNYVPVKKAETQEVTFAPTQEHMYTVQSGDTLYAISQKFNASVDKIKLINNLTSNSLNVGQIIKIQ